MRSVEISTWLRISIGALVGGVTLWWVYCMRLRRSKRHPNADNWQYLGTLKAINFYPVKGGAPVRLEKVECSEFGVHSNDLWERCLVAYEESGAVVYAGSYPRMLSIRSVIVRDKVLRLEAPNMPPLIVDLNELLRAPLKAPEKCKNAIGKRLVECQAEHHEWFSRVVVRRENGLRLYVKLLPQKGEAGGIFPVMVIHESSLHDLNERLSGQNKRVDCQQFRGNLVVDSNPNVPPYDEDRWLWLKFGNDAERSTIIRYNSDCLRCIVVNINVEDYTRDTNFEPLKTLKKYRLLQNPKEPSMGVYFDVYKCGMLNIGDPIYVQYR
ncbi:mitochondrial amidoxime reducing component 2-like isoform X1 [Rhagoletis pomonella]|uniref:mitochondrial amidoxime reducing component 2-like isoform X1 n=1 Tax=Rhagoletis pomonella TaxID=28610 RepID=UPI00177B1A3A|nr:mitochondrial amidoxime reducing component 2-like isoform X1 [Rhagoletis pomonella]